MSKKLAKASQSSAPSAFVAPRPKSAKAPQNSAPSAFFFAPPPMLSTLSRHAWITFFDHFTVAQRQQAFLTVYDCLSRHTRNHLRMLLIAQGSKEKLDSLDEEALITLIKTAFAPSTAQAALQLLEDVGFRSPSVAGFFAFCTEFADTLDSLPTSVRPIDKTAIKRFTSALRKTAPLFADRLVDGAFSDWQLFLVHVLQEANAYGDLLFVRPAAPTQSSSSRRTQRDSRRQPSSDSSAPAKSEDTPPSSDSSAAPKRSRHKCTHCNKLGHLVDRCYQLHGFPERKSAPSDSSSAPASSADYNKITVHDPQALPDDAPVVEGLLLPASQPASPFNATIFLDPGANRNFVSADFLQSLPATSFKLETIPPVTVAFGDNHSAQAHSQVCFYVRLAHGLPQPVNILTYFYVLPQSAHPVVLGRPWLKTQKLHALLDEDLQGRNISVSPTPTAAADAFDFEDCILEAVADSTHVRASQDTNATIDDPELMTAVDELRAQFPDIFQPPTQPCKLPPVKLELIDPTKIPPVSHRRMNPKILKAVNDTIRDMERLNVIEKSTSTTVSPIVPVKKKSGKIRVCVDYTKINEHIPLRKFAQMDVHTTLSQIRHAPFLAGLDLYSGYHQVALAEECRSQYAFLTPLGCYQPTRLMMGPKNSVAYFHPLIVDAFSHIDNLVCYVDDLVIFAKDKATYLSTLRRVFETCRQLRLTLNPAKCVFNARALEILGFTVSADGYTVPSHKKHGLMSLAVPTTVKQMRSFCGLCNTFATFIPSFATIMKPLHELCSKNAVFRWLPEHQLAFDTIKDTLTKVPTLSFPSDDGTLHLFTDASLEGIGACLAEAIDVNAPVSGDSFKNLRPIAFLSRSLNPTQRKWTVTETEAYAAYFAIKSFAHFLEATPFVLHTDHRNLLWLRASEVPKLVRWNLFLQDFQFTIQFIPGSKNLIADSLSRLPVTSAPITTTPSSGASFHNTHAATDLSALLKSLHNSTTGHMGASDLIRKVQDRGIIVTASVKQIVRDFVKSCSICQKTDSRSPKSKEELHTTMSTRPFAELIMDAAGPFPTSASGHRYILLIVDKATRWIELFPLQELSALATANALLQVVSRFGMYDKLYSDRGSNFTSQVTQLLMKALNIEQFFSSPYHPASNGIVERRVAEVTRHLRNLVLAIKDNSAWNDSLCLVQRILNSHQSHATGHAPAQLVYGNAIDLNRRLLPSTPVSSLDDDTASAVSAKQYVNNLICVQNKLLRNAMAFQQQRIDRYLASSPENPTSFPPGQLVLVKYPKQSPSKLATRYFGPGEILSRSGNHYRVKNILDASIQLVHLDRLKVYHHDKFMSATEAAMLDNHEFKVEAIIDHVGSPSKKSTMLFRIRWLGYDSDHDTFEPYTTVKDLSLLTTYAKEHNLAL